MPTEIDRHEVQRLVAAGAQLVDVMGNQSGRNPISSAPSTSR